MSTIASGATVLVREDGPAVRVTLNRPDKRNALSFELMEELIAALEALGGDGLRAVVIEANGPAFSRRPRPERDDRSRRRRSSSGCSTSARS